VSWFRVEGKIAFHAKFLKAGNAAVGAWARMGAWSVDHLTDGYIPDAIANLIASPAEIRSLIDCGLAPGKPGLLIVADGGYRMHDFHDFNPKSDDEKERRDEIRKLKSEAGRRGGQASGEARREAAAKQTRSSDEANAKQNPKQLLPENEAETKQPACEADEANAKQTRSPIPIPIPIPISETHTPSAQAREGSAVTRKLAPDAKALQEALMASDLFRDADPSEVASAGQRLGDAATNTPRCQAGTAVLYLPEAITYARGRLEAERGAGRYPTPGQVLVEVEKKFRWVMGDLNAGKREPLKHPKQTEAKGPKPLVERWGASKGAAK